MSDLHTKLTALPPSPGHIPGGASDFFQTTFTLFPQMASRFPGVFVPGADEFMRADTEPRSCGVLGTASIGASGQRHRTGVIYLECH